MKHDPIPPEYTAHMNELCGILDHAFNGNGPKKIGFALLMFYANENIKDSGRVNYISNTKRDDTLIALKEVIARWEGQR
jgi:hypothetical protein